MSCCGLLTLTTTKPPAVAQRGGAFDGGVSALHGFHCHAGPVRHDDGLPDVEAGDLLGDLAAVSDVRVLARVRRAARQRARPPASSGLRKSVESTTWMPRPSSMRTNAPINASVFFRCRPESTRRTKPSGLMELNSCDVLHLPRQHDLAHPLGAEQLQELRDFAQAQPVNLAGRLATAPARLPP